MPIWAGVNAALGHLARTCPGFSFEECLLKVAAVNGLYGTNLYDLTGMARHVQRLLAGGHTCERPAELVATIAASRGETKRKHVSFASKFCHFFIDQERFPILDDAAERAARRHLPPRRKANDDQHRYTAFCADLDEIRAANGLQVSVRQLDQYLWIAGMYERHLRARAGRRVFVNRELEALFEDESASADLFIVVEGLWQPPDGPRELRRQCII